MTISTITLLQPQPQPSNDNDNDNDNDKINDNCNDKNKINDKITMETTTTTTTSDDNNDNNNKDNEQYCLSLCNQELTTLDISQIIIPIPIKNHNNTFSNLHSLNLSRNKLVELPSEFFISLSSSSSSIQHLDLSRNQIRILPNEIGCLKHLKSLNLLSNKLRPSNRSIPTLTLIQQCRQLQYFDLRYNPKIKESYVQEYHDQQQQQQQLWQEYHKNNNNHDNNNTDTDKLLQQQQQEEGKEPTMTTTTITMMNFNIQILISPSSKNKALSHHNDNHNNNHGYNFQNEQDPNPNPKKINNNINYNNNNNNTKKKEHACDRDAMLLQSQLEPLSTPTLRRRLQNIFGISIDIHDESKYACRSYIMKQLLQAYQQTSKYRQIIRYQGIPLSKNIMIPPTTTKTTTTKTTETTTMTMIPTKMAAAAAVAATAADCRETCNDNHNQNASTLNNHISTIPPAPPPSSPPRSTTTTTTTTATLGTMSTTTVTTTSPSASSISLIDAIYHELQQWVEKQEQKVTSTNTMETTTKSIIPRERPKIQAEHYMILRSPLEFGSKDSTKAKLAAIKLQKYQTLWNLATMALDTVDPKFGKQFTALAVTHNFVGSPHIDTQNIGPFYAISFGDYSHHHSHNNHNHNNKNNNGGGGDGGKDGTDDGHDDGDGGNGCDDNGNNGNGKDNNDNNTGGGGGHLCVELNAKQIAYVDTKHKFAKIDGRFVHWVHPHYKGDRYSLIFYQTIGTVTPQTDAVLLPTTPITHITRTNNATPNTNTITELQ